MVCEGCNCYFSFWAIFFPCYRPNGPKNQNFKKSNKARTTTKNKNKINKKKTDGDIILDMCTKHYD